MHVAPFSYLFGSLDVVVGNVHAARIGYLSVNDDNLTVVASEDVVNPRESDGGVFHDVDAIVTEGF